MCGARPRRHKRGWMQANPGSTTSTASSLRSEEHTSELQSPDHLVCRLLLEKKKNANAKYIPQIADSCRNQAVWIESILRGGSLPIVLTGDHSTCDGTFTGESNSYPLRQNQN